MIGGNPGRTLFRKTLEASVNTPSRYRWFVVTVFFFFMLLHQTDQLMMP